ncbi:unnamed protein product [Brassica rapa subsp. trilocularis]
MFFGRITQLFTAASNQFGAATQPSLPYMPTPNVDGTSAPDSISFGSSGRKNGLRHSASLQDFSSYHGFDPEEAILARQNITWGKNGSSFSKDKGGLPNGSNPSRSWRKWVRASPCMFIQTGLAGGQDTMLCLTAEAQGLVLMSIGHL